MNLFEIMTNIELDDNSHLARLLILLYQFSLRKEKKYIEGITKLAKLDFLLRYPVALERALVKKNKTTKKCEIQEYERQNVESRMVRYKYGPWDFRYREFINILIGKGMVNVQMTGNRIDIEITDEGEQIAKKICKDKNYNLVNTRAEILRRNFDITGTNLKNFIYATFPEIASMELGEPIYHGNLFQ